MVHGDYIFFYFVSTVTASNGTYANSFSYTDSFNVLLDGVLGARIFTLPDLHNIQFEFLDYVFIIIGPNGIYPPEYDVTGNLQLALSATMWDGDITQLGSLMGMGL